MSITPGSIELLPEQAGFLCAHEGWVSAEVPIMVCLGVAETLLKTGTIRPESENPGGGIDWGWGQRNSKAWPSADPSLDLGAVYHARSLLDVRRRAQIAQPSRGGFWPWGYGYAGSPRTAASIGVPAMAARLGTNLLDPARNPYWLLVDNGHPVEDLPVPPQGLYVSVVPIAALRYGNHGAFTSGGVLRPDTGVPLGLNHGDLIGMLQRLLDGEGFWYNPGLYDRYYGGNVRTGVTRYKQLAVDLGIYKGPVDGIWDLEFARLIDGMLHYVHLVKGR